VKYYDYFEQVNRLFEERKGHGLNKIVVIRHLLETEAIEMARKSPRSPASRNSRPQLIGLKRNRMSAAQKKRRQVCTTHDLDVFGIKYRTRRNTVETVHGWYRA